MAEPARIFDAASLQKFVQAELAPLLPATANGGWLAYVGTDGQARFVMVHRVGDEWRVQGALEWDLRRGTYGGGLAVVRSW
jgi:hypothetical protein